VEMTIEQVKILDHFMCSDCANENDEKKLDIYDQMMSDFISCIRSAFRFYRKVGFIERFPFYIMPMNNKCKSKCFPLLYY
jgi:hypothetical protein